MHDQIDHDLPDELQDEQFDELERRQSQRATLSQLLARKRAEAVAGRASSGIEEIWTEDEEAYEGVDDANRTEARILKPTSTAGGLMRSRAAATTRSSVYIRITAQYVDSAAARVGDMLLPSDDRAFEIKPEPIPELFDMKDDQTPAMVNGQPVLRPPKEGEQPAAMGPDGQPVVPATVGDIVVQEMEKAKESATKAERRIDDWLVECNYHAEKRQSIHDRAKIGVSILKGPFPVKRQAKKIQKGADGTRELVILEEIKPASKRISAWNFFPDPSCGENIHNGNYVFERDFLTEKQLRALKGVPGYLEEQIDECLKEGPQKALTEASRKETAEKTQYEVWYFHGEIRTSDLKVCDCKVDDDRESRPALVTMINDRVIKATLNTLDSGSFPYDVTPWQTRSGHWAGIGVARQVREAQGGVNAAVRNLMDNAALCGGPMLAIDRTMLEPADGTWTFTPRKIFYTKDDVDEGKDITKAITAFNIPSAQQFLMPIIDFYLKMAEQTTGMPMLLQGQTGNAPDTLGGQLLATNNASTVLRRIARLDDDCCTEPHIRRYYEYLMLYGEDDSEKGNFSVDARGSSALVERDIQNHATIQMLQLSVNPAFGVDPKKAFAEACKAQRLDPKRFQYSEEELAKMSQQPPPPPPQVQAAQIREEGATQRLQLELQAEQTQQGQPGAPAAPDTTLQVATIRAQTEMDKATLNQNSDMTELEFKAAEAQRQREHEMQMQDREFQMKVMEFAEKRGMHLDDVKTELTKATMELSTQKELSAAALAAGKVKKPPVSPQVATPPMEPVGRAENGQAYAQ